MNVTVITVQPIDYGHGPDTRIEFHQAKYMTAVDESTGKLALHVQSEDTSIGGNIASFQPGEWRCVVRGNVTEHPNAGKTDENGRVAPLTLVPVPGRNVAGER